MNPFRRPTRPRAAGDVQLASSALPTPPITVPLDGMGGRDSSLTPDEQIARLVTAQAIVNDVATCNYIRPASADPSALVDPTASAYPLVPNFYDPDLAAAIMPPGRPPYVHPARPDLYRDTTGSMTIPVRQIPRPGQAGVPPQNGVSGMMTVPVRMPGSPPPVMQAPGSITTTTVPIRTAPQPKYLPNGMPNPAGWAAGDVTINTAPTGWAGLSTPAKVGIVAGGLALAGGAAYCAYKLGQKKKR